MTDARDKGESYRNRVLQQLEDRTETLKDRAVAVGKDSVSGRSDIGYGNKHTQENQGQT